MSRLLAVMFAGLMTVACASKPMPSPTPILQADLMRRPCQLEMPVSDADEDLAVDVQNMECVRKLRLQVYRLQGWVRIAAGVAR